MGRAGPGQPSTALHNASAVSGNADLPSSHPQPQHLVPLAPPAHLRLARLPAPLPLAGLELPPPRRLEAPRHHPSGRLVSALGLIDVPRWDALPPCHNKHLCPPTCPAAPAFGAASTPGFGATSSPAFGATSAPAFGAPASAPAFGEWLGVGWCCSAEGPLQRHQDELLPPGLILYQTAILPLTGGFGAASASAFGASPAPAFGAASSPGFGFASSTPAFGAAPTPAFGAQSAPAFG